jgi:hypothetical protein
MRRRLRIAEHGMEVGEVRHATLSCVTPAKEITVEITGRNLEKKSEDTHNSHGKWLTYLGCTFGAIIAAANSMGVLPQSTSSLKAPRSKKRRHP